MATRSAALALAVALILMLAHRANALCPYHMLWLPGSPLKLPDDHPALQWLTGAARNAQMAGGAGTPLWRPAVPESGAAGSCSYSTTGDGHTTCVLLTGEKWQGSLVEAGTGCASRGRAAGAWDAAYDPSGVCAEFSDPGFAGACVEDAGGQEETRTGFVTRAGDDLSSSCGALRTACETIAMGVFDAAGGKCEGRDGREAAANSSAVCQIAPGIPGGGHMHMDSHWGPDCENQHNQYALPLRWAADMDTFFVQRGGRHIGRIYYDSANNRKRHDWVVVDGEPPFGEAKNTTFIHDHGTFYFIDRDNGACSKMKGPVGGLRPTWVLDDHGAGAVSQYIGPAYVMHGGVYRRVKQWRKTEPLEGAFLIQSYDEESVWETPEGPKRRVLMREAPAGPGVGDAVDHFYNHTTDFDDGVFDILNELDCEEIGLQSAGQSVGVEFDEPSFLTVDSGFLRVECAECNITYSDQPANGSDVHPGQGNGTHLNGSVVIREEAFLELRWEYDPSSEAFSFSLRSELAHDWMGLAFPETTCAMVPADGVLGTPGGPGTNPLVAPYRLETASISGILADTGQVLKDAEMTVADGMQILSFSRKADNGGRVVLDPGAPIEVNWAVGLDGVLGYHGVDGRGCLTINSEAPPVAAAIAVT